MLAQSPEKDLPVKDCVGDHPTPSQVELVPSSGQLHESPEVEAISTHAGMVGFAMLDPSAPLSSELKQLHVDTIPKDGFTFDWTKEKFNTLADIEGPVAIGAVVCLAADAPLLGTGSSGIYRFNGPLEETSTFPDFVEARLFQKACAEEDFPEVRS